MDFNDGNRPASVTALRPGNVALLRPAQQVFDDMLTGWSAQQSSRMLNPKTIQARLVQVRRFAGFCGSLPWEWTPADIEEWTTELVSGDKPCSHGTIRSYQNAVALFCDYLTDRRYGWVERCEELFGTHPVQVCHEWNTVIHTGDHEARPAVRPLSRDEVQQFFDYADDRVDQARTRGKKGWKSVFRDATLFKMIYAFGLRRREVTMLDIHDFTRNPTATEFGRFGVCNVRWGKASRGSQPRRRAVLAVFDWTRPVIEEYVTDVLPLFDTVGTGMLWPTERQSRITGSYVGMRFAEYRDDLGFDAALHPHCLRHSYVISGASGAVRHVRFGAGTARALRVSDSCRCLLLRSACDGFDGQFVSGRACRFAGRWQRVVGGIGLRAGGASRGVGVSAFAGWGGPLAAHDPGLCRTGGVVSGLVRR